MVDPFDRLPFRKASRFGVPRLSRLKRPLSAKPLRALVLFVVLLFLLLTWTATPKSARLHLLVPSTSSNADLCKLLISAQILDYPTPVLINYGLPESEDAYVQHLAKVEGILKYLNDLEYSSKYAEELVLIVDGWDVWFQLPAELLLRRYFEVNAAANERITKTYGARVAKSNDFRQSILFGPDKICWPIDYSRPACWAAPNTTLPDMAFGPQTSDGRGSHNHPRWLNSGTILGPAADLRALFTATMDEIHANHTTDSDQFYLAELYGRQEFARLQFRPDLLQAYKAVKYREDMEADENTGFIRNPNEIRKDATIEGRQNEFHIGIDYESSLFQTVAFWKQYIAWMRAADSWSRPNEDMHTPVEQYSLQLPSDIQNSPPPFTSLEGHFRSKSNALPSWKDVELLYNTVSHQVPALVHFTGDKTFRNVWWQKIWYQSQAKRLREASILKASKADHIYGTAGGYKWHNAQPKDADEVRLRGYGGGWSDRGGWFSWKNLCQMHEDDLYRIRGGELYHSALKPKVDG